MNLCVYDLTDFKLCNYSDFRFKRKIMILRNNYYKIIFGGTFRNYLYYYYTTQFFKYFD